MPVFNHLIKENKSVCVSSIVLHRSRSLIDQLVEDLGSSAGLYYVVYIPNSWEVYSVREDDFGELDHQEMWERFVSEYVIGTWKKVKKLTSTQIDEIKNAPYGFPRGRVVSIKPNSYVVYHGNDTDKLIPKYKIERTFSVENKAKWEVDLHEKCTTFDKNIIKKVLGIKQDWKSVEVFL